MAKQCVRCGRVTNLEERRCPGCFASLSNEHISGIEVASHHLKQAATWERETMWARHTRRGAIAGALVPLLLILSFHPLLVVVGIPVGAATGWLLAWRRWGGSRGATVFGMAMALPVFAIAGSNVYTVFFILLLAICTGSLIGIAVSSTQDL